MKTIAIVVTLLSLMSHTLLGQYVSEEEVALLKEEGWYEGNVTMSNGNKMNGRVKYNDRVGTLAYRDGDNEMPLSVRSVSGFDFFDERQQQRRTFYTFPYEGKTNVEQLLIFEVIREFDNFAFLSRAEPIELHRRYNGFMAGTNATPIPTTTTLEAEQVETIFIMDSKGSIKPYIEVTIKEDGVHNLISAKDRKTKGKIIDEDLLAEYVTTQIYDQLQAYANRNKLKFKRKEDLLKIIDYYSQLSEP